MFTSRLKLRRIIQLFRETLTRAPFTKEKLSFLCYLLGLHLLVVFALHRLWAFNGALPSLLTNSFMETMRATHDKIDPHVPAGASLFIGDSHIQGLAVAAASPQGVNFGLGHDASDSLLRRMPDIKSIQRAGAVIFQVGTNDLLRKSQVDSIIANYCSIISVVPTRTPVFVCSVFPCARWANVPENFHTQVQAVNKALKSLCDQHHNLFFVDINARLGDHDGYMKHLFASADGIHLSNEGYAVWIELLRLSIESDANAVSS